VDCAVREWSTWSDCSISCGNGTQTRTRNVAYSSNFGGAQCPPLVDEVPCNTDPCPIDCILTEWGAWGDCDRLCGNGVQFRQRTINQAAHFAGVPCGATEESQACNVVPCRMDYVRNLIDRVRRLELQNRVAKLEQLQAKLASLAARDRAEQIIEQAKSMKDAAAPFFIPLTLPPLVDQSTATVTNTIDPFPQFPRRSSSSAPPVSSSSVGIASSSATAVTATGTGSEVALFLASLDEKPHHKQHLPEDVNALLTSPLLLETHEKKSPSQPPQRSSPRKFADLIRHKQQKSQKSHHTSELVDDVTQTAEVLLQLASDETVLNSKHESSKPQRDTQQQALLALTDLVAAAVKQDSPNTAHIPQSHKQ